MSEKATTVHVVKRDGKTYREWPDGTETLLSDHEPGRTMTEDEIVAAARADPDNPLVQERRGNWRRLPRTFGVRRRLGLTREEFAARFHIPLETINDWEDGRSVPDPAADTYLSLIARDPDRVAQMLVMPEAAEQRASSNKPELMVVVESLVSEANRNAGFADIKARFAKSAEIGKFNQEV